MPHLLYLSLETLQPKRAAFTHVHGIIDGLAKVGWTTELVASEKEKPKLGHLFGAFCRYVLLNFQAIQALGRSEAVYVRSHFFAWPTVLMASFRSKPVFYEINGPFNDAIVSYPLLRPFSGLLGALYRYQYRMARHLFCVTEGLAAWARKEAGHDRASIMPNGYNETLFNVKASVRPKDLPEGPYALFYGDIARWHGLDTMRGAILEPSWPQAVSLVIIGRQPDQIEAADRKIIWLGRKAQGELPGYIHHAVAGLVPITDPGGRSATGVMPLKLVEMLACGLPVIVSDLPGQADLVREISCGFVFPSGNAAALADCVAKASGDLMTEAMGHHGRVYAEANFRWDIIAQKVDAAIRRELRTL